MSFVTDAVGSVVGGIEDAFGARNKFNATAPVNEYEATQAPIDKSSYAAAIQQALDAAGNGGNQNALIAQLQAASNGQGPNPALAQLHQTTDANAQRAAGAIASARGLNPALAARMAADTAGGVNQQAAGQAATLGAQQQIAARTELAQAIAQKRQQDLGVLGTAGGLQNQQNTGILQNSLGTQGLNQATAAQNANLKLGAQQVNAGVAAQNANTGAGFLGGVMQGGGAALGLLSDGGEVPTRAEMAAALKVHRYAAGGSIDTPHITVPDYSAAQYSRAGDSIKSGISGGLKGLGGGEGPADVSPNAPPLADFQPLGSPTVAPWEGASPLLGAAGPFAVAPYAHGGSVNEYARAVAARGAHDFRVGGPVPGRPAVAGDSERNDVVPAMVSPGEVVLPRSVTQAPDAAQRAAEFVAAIKARKEPAGYGRVLAARRMRAVA